MKSKVVVLSQAYSPAQFVQLRIHNVISVILCLDSMLERNVQVARLLYRTVFCALPPVQLSAQNARALTTPWLQTELVNPVDLTAKDVPQMDLAIVTMAIATAAMC